MSSTAEKVKAAREYAEHHGVKPWTEHIFNVLDALEESEKFNRKVEVTEESVQSAAKVIASETEEPGWSAVVIARAALTAALS